MRFGDGHQAAGVLFLLALQIGLHEVAGVVGLPHAAAAHVLGVGLERFHVEWQAGAARNQVGQRPGRRPAGQQHGAPLGARQRNQLAGEAQEIIGFVEQHQLVQARKQRPEADFSVGKRQAQRQVGPGFGAALHRHEADVLHVFALLQNAQVRENGGDGERLVQAPITDEENAHAGNKIRCKKELGGAGRPRTDYRRRLFRPSITCTPSRLRAARARAWRRGSPGHACRV